MTCGALLRNGRSPARKRKLNGISLSKAQWVVVRCGFLIYALMPGWHILF